VTLTAVVVCAFSFAFVTLRRGSQKINPAEDKTDKTDKTEGQSPAEDDVESGAKKPLDDHMIEGDRKPASAQKTDEQDIRKKRWLLVMPVRASGDEAEQRAVAEADVLFKVLRVCFVGPCGGFLWRNRLRSRL
jgi:hypothetical protein